MPSYEPYHRWRSYSFTHTHSPLPLTNLSPPTHFPLLRYVPLPSLHLVCLRLHHPVKKGFHPCSTSRHAEATSRALTKKDKNSLLVQVHMSKQPGMDAQGPRASVSHRGNFVQDIHQYLKSNDIVKLPTRHLNVAAKEEEIVRMK